VLLLGTIVHALTDELETEKITIEFKASPGVCDYDGGVINAQKEPTVGILPTRITFVRRKIDDLQVVTVGILGVLNRDNVLPARAYSNSAKSCRLDVSRPKKDAELPSTCRNRQQRDREIGRSVDVGQFML
jgi:hypothetical protein